MDNNNKLEATISEAATVIGRELQGFATNSVQSSHAVASYALENVLLHQAAAQQLQVLLRLQSNVAAPELAADAAAKGSSSNSSSTAVHGCSSTQCRSTHICSCPYIKSLQSAL
jgi:hypothetical protein